MGAERHNNAVVQLCTATACIRMVLHVLKYLRNMRAVFGDHLGSSEYGIF